MLPNLCGPPMDYLCHRRGDKRQCSSVGLKRILVLRELQALHHRARNRATASSNAVNVRCAARARAAKSDTPRPPMRRCATRSSLGSPPVLPDCTAHEKHARPTDGGHDELAVPWPGAASQRSAIREAGIDVLPQFAAMAAKSCSFVCPHLCGSLAMDIRGPRWRADCRSLARHSSGSELQEERLRERLCQAETQCNCTAIRSARCARRWPGQSRLHKSMSQNCLSQKGLSQDGYGAL